MKKLIAAKTNPFGTIKIPDALEDKYPGGVTGGALGTLISTLLRALIVIAGVYAVFNLVMAGYGFMSAGDDPKKVQAAWSTIWQTLMGLAFAAGAFVLAAIFGQLIFGKWDFLLTPTIPTP